MRQSSDERRILVVPSRIADGQTRFVVKMDGGAMATWDTEPDAIAFAISVARRVSQAERSTACVLRQDLAGQRVQEARYGAPGRPEAP